MRTEGDGLYVPSLGHFAERSDVLKREKKEKTRAGV